jgi:hypothetical protein
VTDVEKPEAGGHSPKTGKPFTAGQSHRLTSGGKAEAEAAHNFSATTRHPASGGKAEAAATHNFSATPSSSGIRRLSRGGSGTQLFGENPFIRHPAAKPRRQRHTTFRQEPVHPASGG